MESKSPPMVYAVEALCHHKTQGPWQHMPQGSAMPSMAWSQAPALRVQELTLHSWPLGACSKLLLTQVPLACVPSMSWLSWLRALRQGWLHCGADEIAMAEGMESTGLAGSLARQTLVPEGLGLGYEQVGTRQLRSFSSILMGHF